MTAPPRATSQTIRVDGDLVRRVEASAAQEAVRLAESFGHNVASSAAAVEPFDGGALVACGPGRYVNRGVGLGLGNASPAATLDAVEAFSSEHGVPPMVEVSPWVSPAFVDELHRRHYGVAWFRNVFVRLIDNPLQPPSDTSPAHTDHRSGHRQNATSSTGGDRFEGDGPVAIVAVDDAAAFAQWAAILGDHAPPGSSERAVSDEFCQAAHAANGPHDLLLYAGDQPVACGSWNIAGGVAWLGGAATLAAHRGRGHQQRLIRERIGMAAAAGAELAAATALPGGSSARNLAADGFQLLYTQAVMQRAVPLP